jgi:ubiquitin-activating enzyme E1
MDTIEKSNLNRQFLFRPKDVGQCKSTTAANAAMSMNPNVRVKSYEDRVGADTENTFNDDFFDSIDGVVTALDNVEARLYMDQRCMYYRKPMVDSGTLGTKGNTQVVLPYQSENWGASRDPPEASIPICTLKNFPHKIEHTIQWARDFFEGTFTQAAMDVNQYLTNDQFLIQLDSQQNTKIDTLQRLKSSLVDDMPTSFHECIIWSRKHFEDLFLATPCQLLHNFPKDQKTQSGQPFWSGHKRAPELLQFNPNDDAHMAFIIAASNLRAYNYGITGTRDTSVFYNALKTITVPKWAPKQVKIAANDEEAKKLEEERAGSADIDQIASTLISQLPEPGKLAGYKMHPAEFEKDDDSNFHMDFMTACSNLRARNYRIPEANAHKTKQIAGKIIPAIATTTALVTGLVCMELYKIVNNKKFDDFKNAYANLALPLFTFSEPAKVSKNVLLTKDGEWNWSEAWDRIDINNPNMTLNEFLEYIEDKYYADVQMVSSGVTILHSFFFPPSKVNERKAMKLEDVAAQFALKRPLTSEDKYLVFEICACKGDDYPKDDGGDDDDDDDDDDLNLPYVRFKTSM